MSDREIYEGLKRDDRAVVTYVYEQYFASVQHYVTRNGGGEEDALDVFQDAVVALYLNVRDGKYQPRDDSRLGTYLQAIGKNVWRAKRRKQRRLAAVSIQDGPPPPTPDVDEELPDRVEALRNAFDGLGDKCRRILRLFYYEKLPLRRIAELMTFTEKTAKNNKYRCMQALRAKLKSHD